MKHQDPNGCLHYQVMQTEEFRAILMMNKRETEAYLKWKHAFTKMSPAERVEEQKRTDQWNARSVAIYGPHLEACAFRIRFFAKCLLGGTFLVHTKPD